jgi:hypothetical protein
MLHLELLLCVLVATAASAASTGAATGGGLAEAVLGVVRGCAAASESAAAAECLSGRALHVVGHSLSAALDKWRHADVPLLGDNVVLLASADVDDRAPRTLAKGGSAAEIFEMLASFLQSRTLQMRIPREIIPSNLEEGDNCISDVI